MKNCPYWSEVVGCWQTFDGKCDKKCQIFKLIKENKKLKKKLESIESLCTSYEDRCKIPGNCIDSRLCSTCFLGSALELSEEIKDVLGE